ncbi:TetR/AcrR family transcriptional regulator [Nocardia stercoris]|uniref:TetR/AcrR family transcriptional regulator n=1 Tax=Nocardia stercoris TaxID=2483361 RepID=A0A3M2LCM0_9NOCA|nr:TetR family transcriptional regulator [Nocardia stercoris]RMI35261.1 TetR/AcrR family transcriptional regulator [Nocardia stercoris]
MAESPNFQTEMRRLLRDRMLDAARDVVCAEGWGAVNMSRVAKTVGISRPVLYKEIGTKQDLADALIARETDEFLTGIATTLVDYPDDPAGGMTAAAEYALRTGADNPLLKAVLSGRNESDTTLLPALISDPDPILGRAVRALTAVAREQYRLPGLDDDELTSTIEILVRLALSHLFQPTGSIERAVTQIGSVLRSLLEDAV